MPKYVTLLNIVGWLALGIGTIEFIRQQLALFDNGRMGFDYAGSLADSAVILAGVAASLAANGLKDLNARLSNLESEASSKTE